MTDSSEWSDRAPEEGRRRPLARGTHRAHDHGELPTSQDVADALWLWGYLDRGRDASNGDVDPSDIGTGTTTPRSQLGSDPLPTEHVTGEGGEGYEDREIGSPKTTDTELYLSERVPHEAESAEEAAGRMDLTRSPPAGSELRADPPPIVRAVHRALRPLRQSVPSAETVLDEEATADQLVHDALGMLVHRPAQERRWEIVLVADESTSMSLWLDTVPDLALVLERQGVFRDVQVCFVNSDTATTEGLCLRRSRTGGEIHPPSEILKPSGRRILWILTDALGHAWRGDKMSPQLWSWGRQLPVAIVSLLPQHMWHQSGLRIKRIRMHSPGAHAPGIPGPWMLRDEFGDLPSDSEPAAPDRVIPIPVLELSGRWLSAWARFLSGHTPWTDMTAVLAGPSAFAPPQDGGDPWDAPEPFPRARVQRFRALASPTSFDLATHLAAAPLTWPVLRMVQNMVPDASRLHLTELFINRLVRSVAPHDDLVTPERIVFDFEPGVREELLAFGRQSDTKRVLLAVSDLLGRWVPTVRGMAQVLEKPDTAPIPHVTDDNRPFLAIEAVALSALSGPYLARSRRLHALLDSANP